MLSARKITMSKGNQGGTDYISERASGILILDVFVLTAGANYLV